MSRGAALLQSDWNVCVAGWAKGGRFFFLSLGIWREDVLPVYFLPLRYADVDLR